jgi:predicted nucleic-acid-binding protein
VTALDTNVLVRFLVEDDARQSARAAAVVERAIREKKPLFLSHIVVCETVWVLETAYDFGRGEIAHVLGELLRAGHLVVEEAEQVRRALDRYDAGKGDVADYLIAERANALGFAKVATFDRNLHGEPDFFEP